MNKCLTTDMDDAKGLQRAIRPTRFFNIKKMAADFCSAQCIMDITGSLIYIITTWNKKHHCDRGLGEWYKGFIWSVSLSLKVMSFVSS